MEVYCKLIHHFTKHHFPFSRTGPRTLAALPAPMPYAAAPYAAAPYAAAPYAHALHGAARPSVALPRFSVALEDAHAQPARPSVGEAAGLELLPIWGKRRATLHRGGSVNRQSPVVALNSNNEWNEAEEAQGLQRLFLTLLAAWRCCILEPRSSKRAAWDLASLVLVFYDIIWVPYEETYYDDI